MLRKQMLHYRRKERNSKNVKMWNQKGGDSNVYNRE